MSVEGAALLNLRIRIAGGDSDEAVNFEMMNLIALDTITNKGIARGEGMPIGDSWGVLIESRKMTLCMVGPKGGGGAILLAREAIATGPAGPMA